MASSVRLRWGPAHRTPAASGAARRPISAGRGLYVWPRRTPRAPDVGMPDGQDGADARCAAGHLRRRVTPMHVALRNPRFGRLLAALAVSQAGDWLYNLALLA